MGLISELGMFLDSVELKKKNDFSVVESVH
jgi:hypothetical protein